MARKTVLLKFTDCNSLKKTYILKKKKGFSWHHRISSALYRSSRPKVFCKKGVLRNFAKFTGKHLCESLFFNKVAGLRPAILLKKRLWHRCFPMNFAKFLRTYRNLWWLHTVHIKDRWIITTEWPKYWLQSLKLQDH